MPSELLVILSLVFANGVLAGAEIAIISTRPGHLKELVEHGSRGAKAVVALRGQPERFFATVQVGITVVGSAAGAYGGATLADDLAHLLVRSGLAEPWATDAAFVLVVSFVSYVSLVLGELVPKSLALKSAEAYSLAVALPLVWLSNALRPLIWLLTLSSNLVLRPFKDTTSFTEARLSPEELAELVREASRVGSLHPRAGEIAARALALPRLVASDVMIPRTEVVSLKRGASHDALRTTLLEHAHSRFPVVEGSSDRVVGYVSTKDLLTVAWDEALFVLEDLIRPVYFVPPGMSALDLLSALRARRVPFCVVVDEHGAMMGIVTLEDVLEELVGEIFSEHARSSPAPFQRAQDGSVTAQGTVPIRDLNRELGLGLPEGDWVTLAGLCLALAGRIPAPGERLQVKNGPALEILDASARRVWSVRVWPPKPP